MSVAADRVGRKSKALDIEILTAPRLREFVERFAKERIILHEEEEVREATKRRLEGATGSLIKRARKDPMLAKLCQVGMVLADEVRFPSDAASTDTREMLLKGLNYALGLPKEQRHEYQTNVAVHVGEVLRDIEGRLAAVVDEAKASECAAQEAVAERTREHRDALATLETAKAAVVVKTAEVEAAESAVADAESVKTEASAELRRTTKQGEAFGKERAKHTQVLEGPFAALVEGSWETDKEKEKLISKLRTGVAALVEEESMFTAMPLAFGTKPPRSSFDQIIVDQLKGLLDGKITAAEAGVAAADVEIAAGKQKVSTAEELLVTQRTAAEATRERLKEAETFQADSEAQVLSAQKALSDADSSFAARFAARDRADAECKVLADLLGTYQEVLEWSRPNQNPSSQRRSPWRSMLP